MLVIVNDTAGIKNKILAAQVCRRRWHRYLGLRDWSYIKLTAELSPEFENRKSHCSRLHRVDRLPSGLWPRRRV